MSLIKRLFGHKGGPPPPMRNVAELVAPFSRPAVQLLKTAGETQSYFGGTPPLSTGMTWPAKAGELLTFLACIDLESLFKTSPVPWLPSTGRLLFFYDVENQPWGFDPKDRGSWTVMLTRDDAMPPSLSPAPRSLPRRSVSFQEISTYPSWERPEVTALGLSDEESEKLIDVSGSAYGNSPSHQVGGFPVPIQSDSMELECQLASHGVYCGDPSGYNSPEAATLSGGAADWRLLLQVDSDDDLQLMWGDLGMLYFWIREQDAREGRFDNTWIVLQCH